MWLVDSSVWIDHLRGANAVLQGRLDSGEVLGHPLVTGEIALGSIAQRSLVLQLLRQLPQAPEATHEQVLDLVERERLYGLGLGYVDAHLLAATLLQPETLLWTGDRRLLDAARRLGVAA